MAYKPKNTVYSADDFRTSTGTWDLPALRAAVRAEAKQANQRLVRLEKAGLTATPAYRGARNALSGEYNGGIKPAYGGVNDKTGKPRYKERVDKLDAQQLLSELYALGKTIQAKTSTVGQAKKIYAAGRKRLESMGAPAGLSYNQVAQVFTDAALKEASNLYGYQAIIQAIGKVGEQAVQDAWEKSEGRLNLAEFYRELGIQEAPTDDWIDF